MIVGFSLLYSLIDGHTPARCSAPVNPRLFGFLFFTPSPSTTTQTTAKMPKSNSDADENDSLTSDDEAMGPTSERVDDRPAVSYRPSTTGNDIIEDEDMDNGLLRPPQRPIAKFRSSVNKVRHCSLRRQSQAKICLFWGCADHLYEEDAFCVDGGYSWD